MADVALKNGREGRRMRKKIRSVAFLFGPFLILFATGQALACGWALLYPPLDAKPGKVTVQRAPLTTWTQERAFDSAEACESWKSTSYRKFTDETLKQIKESPNLTEKEKSDMIVGFNVYHMAATCVPFDVVFGKSK